MVYDIFPIFHDVGWTIPIPGVNHPPCRCQVGPGGLIRLVAPSGGDGSQGGSYQAPWGPNGWDLYGFVGDVSSYIMKNGEDFINHL